MIVGLAILGGVGQVVLGVVVLLLVLALWVSVSRCGWIAVTLTKVLDDIPSG